MGAFDRLVEEKLQEAIEEGLFDDLPGRGRPLALEDLSGLPADLRPSYLLLKGAGVLPEEMQVKKEALHLEDLLRACEGDEEREALRTKRERLWMRYRLLQERRRLEGRRFSG